MGKKELDALLNLSSWCLIIVEWLFFACHGVVCGLWLWYFLIILTYYFGFGLLLYVPVKDMVMSVRSFYLTTLVTWASG